MKNKEKYDLRELANTLSYNNSGVVIKYDGKDIFYGDENTLIQNFKNILRWLEQDYSPLTESERAYLRAVIKPWRDKVLHIAKEIMGGGEYEQINILVSSSFTPFECWFVQLPHFKTGAMYKGMWQNKKYSLEELGL